MDRFYRKELITPAESMTSGPIINGSHDEQQATCALTVVTEKPCDAEKLVSALRTVMSVPADNPRLLQAQYVALSRQLPLMYFVLLVNTWALAFTHWATAPMWLTLLVPALLTIVCAIRARKWLLTVNRPPPAPTTILATLRGTNGLAGVIAAGFAAWSLSLYPFGDAYAQAHVAFFMGITVIVCIFCMMHLRPAALTTAVVVNTAFVIFSRRRTTLLSSPQQ